MNEVTPLQRAMQAAERPVESDLDRWVATGTRLLEQQRARLDRAESDYQIERVKLIELYRAKMSELANEGREKLRLFDSQHKARATLLTQDIEQLTAMHEAVEDAR